MTNILNLTFKEFLKYTYKLLNKHDQLWIPESYLQEETHLKEPNPSKFRSRYETGLTFSSTWTIGGTEGNYNSDEVRQVDGQPEPEDPIEFDLILEDLAPNLTFMQYKGIRRELMQKDERQHGDYYGGRITEGYKGFKIKDLYDALIKRNIITNESSAK